MRISVIGAGYLGAAHAACLASWGHQVVAVDTDPERLEVLRQGRSFFHEPGLDELIADGVRSGALTFTDDARQAAEAEVHFLCVGTPQRCDGHGADLTWLESAVDELAPHLTAPSLVVGKSTVPVGTAQRLRERVQGRAPAADAVEVAWNPEFLREGYAVQDTLRPDRLVFGVESDRADRVLREVFAPALADGVPAVRTDLATAELAKVSANAMLAARISLVNLLAEVCEAASADVGDLTTILGLDPRIGSRFLAPGIGFGGGCLPKDIRAFVARAEELGLGEPATLLRQVDAVNTRQRERTIARSRQMLGGTVEGRRVAALGAAFKAGIDDVRDSPALHVACALEEEGAAVTFYDPMAGDNAAKACPSLTRADTIEEACLDADLVLVLTEWDDFRDIDPSALAEVVAARRVIDARLVLDAEQWRSAGWEFYALGRGPAR